MHTPKILLVILSLVSFACHHSNRRAKDALVYKDLAGHSAELPVNIRRIVLLRSKDIYSLSALLGDELPSLLVAWGPDLRTDDREAYDKFVEKYPALKTIPETGSIYNDGLNTEQLVALHPDLIIADRFILDRHYKYIDKMKEADLPVLFLDGSTDPLTGSQKGLALLGQVLHREQRARKIIQFVDSQFNTVLTRVAAFTERPPSVYLEAGSEGPGQFAQTYGSSGYPPVYTSWGAVLHRLRVRNIADGIAQKQEKINPEYILKANPDIIVITGQAWTTAGGAMQLGYSATREYSGQLLRAYRTRPGWSSLSAIQHHRLYSVFHNTAVIVCFAAVEALAKDCYPPLFSDLDPEKQLRCFYSRFLPISYSGTWMIGPV